MRPEHRYYDVFPRVFAAGRASHVTIRPRARHVAFSASEYMLVIVALDNNGEVMDSGGRYATLRAPLLRLKPAHGALSFSHVFPREQAYSLALFAGDAPQKPLAQFDVYCVAEDLYGLRPFKVETHSHTTHSDGAESEEFVPPYYRRHGYDVMAITDHGKYTPSLDAIKAFEGCPSAFALYPGEEVHAPGNPTHIVNFGGNRSVNAVFQQDFDLYDRQVKGIADAMPIPDAFDAYRVASCIWVCRQIHSAGGLSILCHPCYQPVPGGIQVDGGHGQSTMLGGFSLGYNVSSGLVLYLLTLGIFDAWEVFGFSPPRNNRHLGTYMEALRQGIKTPVLGANDSHGVAVNTQWFNRAHTLVLAKSCDKEDILEGIRRGDCVAVQEDGGDRERLVVGQARHMAYALFLLEQYAPAYTELCRQESLALADFAAGVPGAKEELARICGRPQAFQRHFFEGLPD